MSNFIDRDEVINLLVTISHQSQVPEIIRKLNNLPTKQDRVKEMIEKKIQLAENNQNQCEKDFAWFSKHQYFWGKIEELFPPQSFLHFN